MSRPIREALEEGRDYWERHARRDPLWAILSEAGKRDGQWDAAQFFQSGIEEIRSLLFEVGSLDVECRRGTALDFGCGVGRLTQALATHFERVVGVDISASMQALATRVNRFPLSVSYVCNQSPDLNMFAAGSFDFIISSIVLQHVEPEIAVSYIREFCRVLAPGGVAVFQLPSGRRRYVTRAPIATAMPESAYRASLNVLGAPAAAAPPGADVMVDVEVTNLGAIDWERQKYGMIRAGNHWFDGAGDHMLTRDDGRTAVPAVLRAGATCCLPLMIRTPPHPGRFHCEIDLVHEGVTWFQDKGSTPARFAVRIAHDGEPDHDPGQAPLNVPRPSPPARDAVAPPEAIAGVNTEVDDPGDFPMHGIPIASMVALIASQGVTLVHIQNDHSCGDDWVSYRYFIHKPRD